MKHCELGTFVHQPSETLELRLTRWSLTRALRASWALSRLADRVERTSLRLDAWVNLTALQRGVDMLDVIPLEVIATGD